MRSWTVWIAVVIACAVPIGACGDDDTSETDPNDAPEDDAGRQEEPSQPDAARPAEPDAGPPEPTGTRTLFYLDIASSRVLSVDPEVGAEQEILLGAGTLPDGIALDLEAGHIYWTTMGLPTADDGTVMRVDLDGQNLTTIVEAGGTHTPKQMKIDFAQGKLYWSDREGMRVMRANLDGSDIETLVTVATGEAAVADAANHCVGLALDEEARMVYWSQKGPDNGGRGSIRRAAYDIPDGESSTDRSDIEVLLEDLPEPVDLELDLEERLIYWTDRGDNTVNRAPMDAPASEDREILVRNVPEAIGIALDLHAGDMFYTSMETGIVAAAKLDGSDARDVVDSTGFLVGIAVGYVDE
jgi:hypothetical protein